MNIMTMIRSDIRPKIPLGDHRGPALALGRCHEIAGPARRGLAAFVAGLTAGPTMWIAAMPDAARLHPPGLHGLLDPAQLVCVRPSTPIEALWAAEEALRSGAVGCVVLETPVPPALTPVRRLNLAAAGVDGGVTPPLCLVVLPEGGAAGAVETRWFADHDGSAGRSTGPAWRVSLVRDKGGPPGAWQMRRENGAMRVVPSGGG